MTWPMAFGALEVHKAAHAGLATAFFVAAARSALLAATVGTAAPVAIADEGSAASCTIVFGQGRNFSEEDTRANTSWNDVNRAFNAQVASELGAAGDRMVALLAPVEATDRPAIIAALTSRADREGCSTIIETAIFANDAEHLLVVRLRAYPVLRGASPAATRAPRIGDPVYTDQQEFQLTQRTLERLAPAALGKAMAASYLGRQAR